MGEPQFLIDRVRDAAAHARPLRMRGGGTKDFYGEALQGELLDTREWRGIASYEPSELVVTVRAGTSLAELEAALAERGQCLPFEPPHFGADATVGGMVAAGLSGPARASVGAVRDYVLGLQLVNGRGELLVFGGQVMKNVAGYDVSRLMVGALGTLGLIVEVSLKVLPVAPAEATLRFDLAQGEALQRLHAWGGRPLPLNASSWHDDGGTPRLHVRLRGAQAAVEAACRTMGGERIEAADAVAHWAACREQRHAWFTARDGLALWRLSVAQTAAPLDLGAPTFLEWHGGQRWVHAGDDEAAKLRDVAQRAGGHATLFRPSNADVTTPRFAPLAPALAHIQRELKRQFDPADIFNPGRLFAEQP